MKIKLVKFISILSSLTLLVFTFSGCGMNMDTTNYPEAPATVSDVSPDSFDDNVLGLSNYFREKGYVAGDPTSMSADFIGAKEGYKYQFKYSGSKVSVELYEYDPDNLSDRGKEVLQTAKDEGKVTVLNATSDATVSNNGRFLMMYKKDKSNEDNVNREGQVQEDFKLFKS